MKCNTITLLAILSGFMGGTIQAQGTVTVVGSGSLTNTALVTGGGTTTIQTPSTTSTIDASGNAVFAGTLTGTEFIGGTTFSASGGEMATPSSATADTFFFSSTNHIPQFTKSGNSTVDATMVVPATIQVPQTDMICAAAADSVASAAISGGSSTSSAITITVPDPHPLGYQVGDKITVTGVTPTGYNVTGATITGLTTTSITYSSTNNPAAWSSGGTAVKPCSNAAAGTTLTPFATTYTIPANWSATGKRLRITATLRMWTPATIDALTAFDLYAGSTHLTGLSGTSNPQVSMTASGFEISWTITARDALGNWEVSTPGMFFPGFSIAQGRNFIQTPATVGTSAQTLYIKIQYGSSANAKEAVQLAVLTVEPIS